MAPRKLAIIGYGKIAEDQHVPAIRASPAFELAAVVSGHADHVAGVDRVCKTPADLYRDAPDIGCVAVCGPPAQRFAQAREALLAGKSVLLEKPPASTLGEARVLSALAEDRNLTLLATWHARANPGVVEAARRLRGQTVERLAVTWREDVRKWHPGQDWVWGPAGFGVFDPGINALSIATAVAPCTLFVREARFSVPSNRQQPIAAEIGFGSEPPAAEITAVFDWRETDSETWMVEVQTREGARLALTAGGAKLEVDGEEAPLGPAREYPDLYARFAELLDVGGRDVDLRPFELVADAFLCADRKAVEPFTW